MHVTVDTVLDRVKAMAPMLCASAAEAEAQRRLARPVVDAVRHLPCGCAMARLLGRFPAHVFERGLDLRQLSWRQASGRILALREGLRYLV